ncbi:MULTISPECIES: Hsp70 family protein [unclassified Novosphingobium]|uniref:Hsp70 family protein n=1 Tax=unclassified Novosphingobium TaxID=2644732 RepID=UPI0006C8B21E|nr:MULTISPECIES: Hsp70 family protein [unclassified Novosphingobium]KPH65334.1 molecular chaperone Hsp70 [Novosphingobium sp. ST904]TCM30730.1 putative chaperone protein [Novosphingobium sp. ST904]WRT94769.1 Hsp70 family protein [Novosphingobium sp. RL4]
MSDGMTAARTVGIDFGTTNSVMALSDGEGGAGLVDFAAPDGTGSVFRSALCFWQDDDVRGGLAHEAGPWAIAEFLDFPQGSRFLQSFKSVAANPGFDSANLFEKRLRFEELGRVFLEHLIAHGGEAARNLPGRVIVGRPVRYVGARPDAALARTRYDAMFSMLGSEIHYVYEPLGAAYSFASRLSDPATLLVADFGGGTSDFSIVRVEAPGTAKRCTPLGSAGVGIAGDRFDYRIMDRLVLPMLGKGGTYRSFDKVLQIPDGHFVDFGDWSRLALMRNRRTLEELARLKRSATDGAAIGRMIAVVENELGYPLYDAVGKLKRSLSGDDRAHFHFESPELSIEADVTRAEFEEWIAPDLQRIAETVDLALQRAGMAADQIDHVFLTGGSSLIPAVRRMFEARFGESRIDSGEELTSIAHGLALIGSEPDLREWTVQDDTAD